MLLIAGITCLATISVVTGLDVGIKILSQVNLVVAGVLLAAVLLLGPTLFLLNSTVANLGDYLNNLISMSFFTGSHMSDPAIREEPSYWVGSWTVFYWAWWVSWSPFVGMFIAKISFGRTVRQFVAVVLLVPMLLTVVWMTVFGDSALHSMFAGEDAVPDAVIGYAEVDGVRAEGFGTDPTVVTPRMEAAIAAVRAAEQAGASGTAGAAASEEVVLAEGDPAMGLFALLGTLPWSTLTSILALFSIVAFFVTSSDSGSLVIDTITSGGSEDPPVWQRIFWATTEGIVAAVLLLGEGLGALQTATVLTGLPFTILLWLMCVSLWIGLRRSYAEQRVQVTRHAPQPTAMSTQGPA